jgi:arylsulfatase A-like enzyme
MSTLQLTSAFLVVWIAGCASSSQQAPTQRPNIILIVTDDQGWADVGCYGATNFATPNLDRLAREGVRFTDFYVAQPVCSASRAAILTGCYPNRIGIDGALGPSSKHGLSARETTLAELCRQRGYATAAFGKWHLGHRPEFLPTRHGFERFRGIPYSNDMGPGHATDPASWGDLPFLEGERTVELNPDQSRFSGEFSADAVQFIRESAAARAPFFVYLAQPMPHVPLAVALPFRDAILGERFGNRAAGEGA